ncbi:hypothetical protein D3C71_1750980 [compost metagenome]
MGRNRAHVGHQLFQLVLGAMGRKVRNLGFEAVDQVVGGIHDGGAEIINSGRIALHGPGKAAGFRIQAHAQHGVVLGGCGAQLVDEWHDPYCKRPPSMAFAQLTVPCGDCSYHRCPCLPCRENN